mgnify:CR=1 FL=1
MNAMQAGGVSAIMRSMGTDHVRGEIRPGLRCPRCGGTVWHNGVEWGCLMCARPAMSAPAIEEAIILGEPSRRRRQYSDERAVMAMGIDAWIEAYVVLSPANHTTARDLLRAYRLWATTTGHIQAHADILAERLWAAGAIATRDGRKHVWMGIRLLSSPML